MNVGNVFSDAYVGVYAESELSPRTPSGQVDEATLRTADEVVAYLRTRFHEHEIRDIADQLAVPRGAPTFDQWVHDQAPVARPRRAIPDGTARAVRHVDGSRRLPR